MDNIADIIQTVNIIAEHHHGESGHEILEETFELITDPAHALTEIFYGILFELLIIPTTIFIYRKAREPKLRKEIHQEIDKEHGIEPHE